ncbi:MAG: hypothetical protein UW95_C0006G0019 [Parcubacteria group bacterium GW2011_GWC1_45_14]|nr:MAG: hypothetical protein UW95_C0006G0019 [Parcubacteria group bacterium GW2011_GWC1_45_14]
MHSVLFFLILEAVVRESVSDFLSSLVSGNLSLLFLITIVYVLVLGVSALKIGKRWAMLPIPIMLGLSSVGLLAFIDSDTKKFAFIVLTSIVYYFCLLGLYRFKSCHKDQTARGMIAATAVSAIFLFYCSAYGIYLNFSIPLWVVMILFLLPTTLISYQYFQLIEEDKGKVWLYSLVIGLAMTEISWVLNFWPFGYLTTGVTMLIFYYVLWDMVQSYFLKIMSKGRVVTNIVFFGILATMVLMSSRWLPVV